MTCASFSGGDSCAEPVKFYAGDYPWILEYSMDLDGEPVDLTGLTMVLRFKATPTDDDADAVHVTTFPVPAGDDATNGLVAVVLGTEDIAALPVGNYWVKTTTQDGESPPVTQTYGDPFPMEVAE